MSGTGIQGFDTTEAQPLRAFAERAYLDYSMYVVLDRALPHVADGLKPVQRRIIYAMSELGLSAGSRHKKSARTVGDVLGKYHPHGDTACYEAMVLMAQPFSFRYPLVDGQGNWGSPDDPKSFAAMRYTEARLAKFSEVLLSEVDAGTTAFIDNFDGTTSEPAVLPARLPNVLLNGAAGIAVGMATDLPPHNIREIVKALEKLLDKPEASVAELCRHIPGPDFPTRAQIITPRIEMRKMYETGHGSVRARATWMSEGASIVINELPFQVSGAKIVEQVAAQITSKKLPLVDDVRDESDHEHPTRIVIVPRSNRVDVERLMQHLFATTDLERSYRVNMNVIGLDRRPRTMNLKELLTEWLSFRIDTVRKRLEHRLAKVLDRMHVLEGLLIAFLNIDEVIACIRQADEPKPALMEQFGVSERQAEAILELRLRQLAKLEEIKIRGEQDELAAERDSIQGILGHEEALRGLVRDELRADADKFGDKRRSPIVEVEAVAEALDETELTPSEPVSVVLSARGWVRAAKGHEIDPESLNYRTGDEFRAVDRGKTNQSAVFLDSTGRTYTLAAHTLPSARGQGEPLSGRLNPADGASFMAVMVDDTNGSSARFVMSTDAGYGFVAPFSEMVSRNRAGKALLSVPAGAGVVLPGRLPTDPAGVQVACLGTGGYLLVLALSELPELNRGKGVKLLGIPKAKLDSGEERMCSTVVLAPGAALKVEAGKRTLTLKPTDLKHYRGERGKRGMKLPRGYQRVERAYADR